MRATSSSRMPTSRFVRTHCASRSEVAEPALRAHRRARVVRSGFPPSAPGFPRVFQEIDPTSCLPGGAGRVRTRRSRRGVKQAACRRHAALARKGARTTIPSSVGC
jgi:hypothetical protein